MTKKKQFHEVHFPVVGFFPWILTLKVHSFFVLKERKI